MIAQAARQIIAARTSDGPWMVEIHDAGSERSMIHDAAGIGRVVDHDAARYGRSMIHHAAGVGRWMIRIAWVGQ